MELSRDRKSCHRSCHVDRRYFKVRELCFEGHVRVEHIDTKENLADVLTKPLDQDTFDKHRERLMGCKLMDYLTYGKDKNGATTIVPKDASFVSEGGVSAHISASHT